MQSEDINIFLLHEGQIYTYTQTFHAWEDDDGAVVRTPYEVAEYLYEEGNYACDCNRSLFLEQYCAVEFPDASEDDFCPLPCGETITLIKLVK